MNKSLLVSAMLVNILTIYNILAALESNTLNLSVLNDSDTTVLIMYERSRGAIPRVKLLESGEAIDFGRVYEASVQSYSTLWGYIAPAKHVLFSARMMPLVKQVACLAVRIKGITGRTLFHPFGEWDYEVFPGKKIVDLPYASCQCDSSVSVLDAFPTAKRKIMYTPRYILGLPYCASVEDALEAAVMLESTWRAQSVVHIDLAQKFASNVLQIIDDSRKAFQQGNADVPLHIPVEMRCSNSVKITESEEAGISWS